MRLPSQAAPYGGTANSHRPSSSAGRHQTSPPCLRHSQEESIAHDGRKLQMGHAVAVLDGTERFDRRVGENMDAPCFSPASCAATPANSASTAARAKTLYILAMPLQFRTAPPLERAYQGGNKWREPA